MNQIKIASKPYRNSQYLNLLESCRQYGYVKIGKGKPRIDDLYSYIYKNMGKREPIPIKRPTKKYNCDYYNKVCKLAVKNGLKYKKVGKISIHEFIEHLIGNGVTLPEKTIVIHQKRIEYSECKNNYSRTVFRAKALGYHKNSRGRPSIEQLEMYISEKIG